MCIRIVLDFTCPFGGRVLNNVSLFLDRVTLEDLYNGKSFNVTVDRKAVCTACQG